eukprot:162997_1
MAEITDTNEQKEWFITDNNEHLFYPIKSVSEQIDELDVECDRISQQIKELEMEIYSLENESETLEIKSIDDEENVESFEREYFHSLQQYIAEITTENVYLKQKLLHKDSIIDDTSKMVEAYLTFHIDEQEQHIGHMIINELKPHDNCTLCAKSCRVKTN